MNKKLIKPLAVFILASIFALATGSAAADQGKRSAKRKAAPARAATATRVAVQTPSAPALADSIRGVVTMSQAGSTTVLFAGQQVPQGARLRTEHDSSALLRFEDGSVVALRPDTELTLDSYRYDRKVPARSSFVMSLLRGGMRSVSGLLGKANRDAYRLNTPMVTIGIRGTDYVARICEKDCFDEQQRTPPKDVAIVARVGKLKGTSFATGYMGLSNRELKSGDPVYRGELLRTSSASELTMVLPDDGRLLLTPETMLRIDRFDFDPADVQSANVQIKVLAGRYFATTGHIKEARNNGYHINGNAGGFETRGTSIGGCVGKVCGSVTVTVTQSGASASGEVSDGEHSASGEVSADSNGVSGKGTTSHTMKNTVGQTQQQIQQTANNASQTAQNVGSTLWQATQDAAGQTQQTFANAAGQAQEHASTVNNTVTAHAGQAAQNAQDAAAGTGLQHQYDLTGAVFAVVGVPDTVVSGARGVMTTISGVPVIVHDGDKIITTWVETMVTGAATAHGGTMSTGTVTRTEIVSPAGKETVLVFNATSVSPIVNLGVAEVGGPMISMGNGRGMVNRIFEPADGSPVRVTWEDSSDAARAARVAAENAMAAAAQAAAETAAATAQQAQQAKQDSKKKATRSKPASSTEDIKGDQAKAPDSLALQLKSNSSVIDNFSAEIFEGKVIAHDASGDTKLVRAGQTLSTAASGLKVAAVPAETKVQFADAVGKWSDVTYAGAYRAPYGEKDLSGLYMSVNEGAITATNPKGKESFGLGEAGFAGENLAPEKLGSVPSFLLDDPYLKLPASALPVSCPTPAKGGAPIKQATQSQTAAKDKPMTLTQKKGLDLSGARIDGLYDVRPVIDGANTEITSGREQSFKDITGGKAGGTDDAKKDKPKFAPGNSRYSGTFAENLRGGGNEDLSLGGLDDPSRNFNGGSGGKTGQQSGLLDDLADAVFGDNNIGGDSYTEGQVRGQLKAEGGTPTGNGEADARELAYAQSVGGGAYKATKDLTSEERQSYWSLRQGHQQRGTNQPQGDDNFSAGGNGVPFGTPEMQRETMARMGRAIAGKTAAAGGANDGRGDRDGGGGSGGGVVMQRDDKLGVAKPENNGRLNLDAVYKINQYVNPGSK